MSEETSQAMNKSTAGRNAEGSILGKGGERVKDRQEKENRNPICRDQKQIGVGKWLGGETPNDDGEEKKCLR